MIHVIRPVVVRLYSIFMSIIVRHARLLEKGKKGPLAMDERRSKGVANLDRTPSRDVTNSAHHSVTKRLPTGHFTVVANGCVGGLDHKHGHAVKVLG